MNIKSVSKAANAIFKTYLPSQDQCKDRAPLTENSPGRFSISERNDILVRIASGLLLANHRKLLETEGTKRRGSLEVLFCKRALISRRYLLPWEGHMKDPLRTNQELIEENLFLNRRVQELEQAESAYSVAEKALRESEQRYRFLTENIKDVIWILDVETMYFRYVSPSVERLRGYTPEEIVAEPLTKAVVAEDGAYLTNLARSRAEEILSGKEPPGKYYINEVEQTCKDGSMVWTEVITSCYINPENSRVEVHGVTRDITDRKLLEEALRESEQRYRTVFDNTGTATVIIEQDTIISLCNAQFERLSSYAKHEIEGKKSWTEFVVREDMDRMVAQHSKRREHHDQALRRYEFRFIPRDGKIRDIDLVIDTIPGTKQSVASLTDITDRKHAEEELRLAEEKYRSIFENAVEGIFQTTPEGRFVSANTALAEMFGYDSPEDMMASVTDVGRLYVGEGARHEHLCLVDEEGKIKNYDTMMYRKDGSICWVSLHTRVVRDQVGAPLLYEGFVENITDRRKAMEELRDSEDRYRELSIVDDLTQLYNSRHFYRQLKVEIDRVTRYGLPLTLLLLDLDDFKVFNDTFGHIEGDKVLLCLGHVIKRCLRQTDSAYRYGGEEFTILLPMTTEKDGFVTAERIRTEFKKEMFFPVPDNDVHITVSIGIAQYNPQEDMKAFVHRVDQFMYKAKRDGKDQVCCEP